jgi:hypothetical protein
VDDTYEAVAKVGGFGTEKNISQKQERCGPHEKPFLNVLGIRSGLELLYGKHSYVFDSHASQRNRRFCIRPRVFVRVISKAKKR